VHDPAPSDLTVKATDFLYNMQLTDLLYGLYFGTKVIYSFGLYKNVMMTELITSKKAYQCLEVAQ
jgi:hypothetical protein